MTTPATSNVTTRVSVHGGLTHLPISTFVPSHPTPQAEALVQRAQQSILSMEDIPDDNPLSLGRLPLERRLKRV
jgi:hypothetical protein